MSVSDELKDFVERSSAVDIVPADPRSSFLAVGSNDGTGLKRRKASRLATCTQHHSTIKDSFCVRPDNLSVAVPMPRQPTLPSPAWPKYRRSLSFSQRTGRFDVWGWSGLARTVQRIFQEPTHDDKHNRKAATPPTLPGHATITSKDPAARLDLACRTHLSV